MDGFERRREQKKQDILKAALALFIDYGMQKVSVAEIAKKANVSQVTIYNYFESKDNLVQIVLKYYVDKIWEEQRKLLDSDLPFVDKIKQFIFEKNDLANEMSESFFLDFMKDYSTGRSYVEDLYEKEALPRLIKLFNNGKEQGYIDSGISNEAILMYLHMFQEYIRKEDVGRMMLPYTEEISKLFFYGIVGNSTVDE
ncbi:TetR/AcrR family transcriptional regulator [Oceanobacillus bengalensis]|uniref:TetR/AcrR family transcriptional regulator n=1 Tax=Oceanobacillus bengalensis TaxID=1435466 RepID=A0A494YU19_9BACI|nr:TetR/AcrR family transcriptional regulator [Oceanobacillus bengalensis]RKQ13642.1 TetR/AcrR family transcriptional regulator [Oceanobacillus bengalensis]